MQVFAQGQREYAHHYRAGTGTERHLSLNKMQQLGNQGLRKIGRCRQVVQAPAHEAQPTAVGTQVEYTGYLPGAGGHIELFSFQVEAVRLGLGEARAGPQQKAGANQAGKKQAIHPLKLRSF